MVPMISASTLFGVVLLAVGAFLYLREKKRRFDRTNKFGVERFSTYWQKLRARAVDGAIGFTGIILLSAAY